MAQLEAVESEIKRADAVRGLKGEYFNLGRGSDDWKNCFHASPVVTRVDPQIHFYPNWYGFPAYGALPIGVNREYFAVRWTGEVRAPIAGGYLFRAHSDNGLRVWVNSILVIDHWSQSDVIDETSKQAIQLTKGQRYPIKVEYLQGWGDAHLTLHWKLSDPADLGVWQIIPQECLIPAR
ncbi:MAG TPA: PA14 domain-containing protein [Ktedonobacteraceae bacterium]